MIKWFSLPIKMEKCQKISKYKQKTASISLAASVGKTTLPECWFDL